MLGSYVIACISTVCVLVCAGNNRILRTSKIIYSLLRGTVIIGIPTIPATIAVPSTTTNRTSRVFII